MKIYAHKNKWHLYPDCRGIRGERQSIDAIIIGFDDAGAPIIRGTLYDKDALYRGVCKTCLRSKARIFKIATMQKMRSAGCTMQEIGDAFGVSRQRIYQYLEE